MGLLAMATVLTTPALAGTTTVFIAQDGGGEIVNQSAGTSQSYTGNVTGGDYIALADFGVLKAYANQAAPTTVNPGFTYLQEGLGVTTSFTDVITANAGGGVTSGNFLASILVSGTLDPQASVSGSGNVGFASMQINIDLPLLSQSLFSLSFTRSNYGGFTSIGGGSLNGNRYGGPFTGQFNFAIPFENLVGQTVRVSLKCGAAGINVGAGQTAGGTCAFNHSLYWGGVSGAVDQNNAPIAALNLASSSGFNYQNAAPGAPAVPEPASWTMLITGFGLTGAALRRRRAVAA
ncbi:MAG: hypothetical protein CFE37_05920 [Alphaproteobacteria bacterium PA4]|nr:MAG: hypothetical protein CFE37_05920 [Alphaproteobacteria bacterium PA4]